MNPQCIFQDDELEVHTIILSHRIACTGFLFRERNKPRKLIKEKLKQYAIPVEAYAELKKGKDYVIGETIIPNSELTHEAHPPRSYAFCSDTIYDETLVPRLQNIDLLYHEATFLNEHIERAKDTYHSTAAQAATIAKHAGVKRLIIGHFSPVIKIYIRCLKKRKRFLKIPRWRLKATGSRLNKKIKTTPTLFPAACR